MDKKIGRNDPCPCGSGKKYKKCCMHLGTGKTETYPSNNSNNKWLVESAKLDSVDSTLDTLKKLYSECCEQFPLLSQFGVTDIHCVKDMVTETESPPSVEFFHYLKRDSKNNWVLHPHIHLVGFFK